MKVRNIAFFGVMASILGVGYANADTPATVIASKAYADTKEATANKANATTKAQWDAITDRTTKFPTVRAVDAALSDLSSTVSGILTSTPSTTDTSHALTNAQTTTELNKKVDIDQGDDNKGKVFVTDNSGKQKVYKLGTNLSIDHTNSELKVGTAALGSAAYTASTAYATAAQGTKADSSIQGVKVNNTALTPDSNGTVNVTAAEGSTNGTIAVNGTDVAVHGLGTAAYTASTSYATSAQGTKADSAIQSVKLNGTALTPDSNKAVNISLGDAASLGTEADSVVTSTNTTKLPTVGGVQKGIAKQGTATVSWKNVEQNTEGAGANLYASKTKQDEYLPTVKAVETRITEESGTKQDKLGGSSNGGKAVIAGSTAGAVTYRTISTAKPTSTTSTDLVTAGAVATGLADKANKATGLSATTTNSFVKYNAEGIVTYGVDARYKNLINTLNDINSASAATCSNTNPCVLSYIGTGFKWTNMDIDGLTVNTTVGDN